MSIPQESKNSNILNTQVSEKLVLSVLLVSVALLSFAIGRISAFSEYNSPKTDVIINNVEAYNYDSN